MAEAIQPDATARTRTPGHLSAASDGQRIYSALGHSVTLAVHYRRAATAIGGIIAGIGSAMALIILFGPPAVGKMTVGQELERMTGFKLFHNHVAIEVVAPFFSYGTSVGRRLVGQIRRAFFDAFAADTETGTIFTFVWAFEEPGERDFIEGVAEQFRLGGHEVFWVELQATFEVRRDRNRSDNRLANKPSKRDLDWSDQHIRELEGQYRFASMPGELDFANYLRIDNTRLSAKEVAAQICGAFALGHVGRR